MPIPAQRDLETTRTVLRDWIAPKLAAQSDSPVTDVAISQLDAPSGSGFSNETFLADITWNAGGHDGRRVERHELALLLAGAADLHANVGAGDERAQSGNVGARDARAHDPEIRALDQEGFRLRSHLRGGDGTLVIV